MKKDAAATREDAQPDQPGGTGRSPHRSGTSLGRRLLKDVSLLVSLASVIVAVISATVAYSSSRETYVSAQRGALVEYLQELNRLAQNDVLEESVAQTLVAQATWILPDVPDVPAVVYRQLGEALVNDSPTYQEDALPLLDRAIELASKTDDEYEQVAARRLKARIYEGEGDLAAMRNEYRLAVGLSEQYSGPNLQRRHTVPAFTHVFWGEAETRARNCEEADRQHRLAQGHAEHLTGENLDTRIRGLATAIQACRG